MFFPALLSSLLFAQVLIPSSPATDPDPAYPIHVQLAQQGDPSGRVTFYHGRGNILGDTPIGFDYVTDCYRESAPIQSRDPNSFFQARWKKQDERLEIIMQQIGNSRASRCELRVTLQPTPYRLVNNFVNPMTAAPFIPATVADPDYPLHVQLFVSRTMYSGINGSHAEGRGNILDPPEVGFDFYDSCDQRFAIRYDPNMVFQARWKRQDLTLEVLLQEVGSNKISHCDLELTIQPQPYDLFPGHRPPVIQLPAPVAPPSPSQPSPQ
jgi:hypothetical protein